MMVIYSGCNTPAISEGWGKYLYKSNSSKDGVAPTPNTSMHNMTK